MKDELTDNLNNKQIKALFEANVNEVPDKIQAPVILHFVADGLCWGRYNRLRYYLILYFYTIVGLVLAQVARATDSIMTEPPTNARVGYPNFNNIANFCVSV